MLRTISARARVLVVLVAIMAALPATAAARHARSHRRHRSHATEACSGAQTPAAGASTAAMRDAVLCLINQERTSRGLPPLRESWRLDRSAQAWSGELVSSGSFTHGSDPGSRISAVGFSWSAEGENIATGYPTPQAVVAAWMASAGHCENILDPSFTFVGTGVDRHPVRGFASGPATWVQDFGLPMGHPAPSGNWGPAHGCPYQG